MMKFIDTSGGLGNQMFHYAFMLSFRASGEEAHIVPIRYRMKKEHNGYELDKVFHLPSEDTGFSMSKVLFIAYRHMLGFFPKAWWPMIDRCFGIVTVRQVEQDKYSPQLVMQKGRVVFFRGAWQSELYFERAKEQVVKIFNSFRMDKMSQKTLTMLNRIESVNAVSVHVRRGDYLAHNSLGGVCTLEYYRKAVQYMNNNLESPRFFVFSDDKKWIEDNIEIENATFVDFNTGVDSWQDMFLMSRCKNNIIANSSFSWWGAYLNGNMAKIVIAPKKWQVSSLGEDIVDKQWIRI